MGIFVLLRSHSDIRRIQRVPAELLEGCVSLHTLDVHDNPITADELRSTKGFF